MSEFGWTRLAYLTITLAVLAALVRLGPPGLTSLSNHFSGSHLALSGKEAQAKTTPEGTFLEKTSSENTTTLENTALGKTTLENTTPAEKKTSSGGRSPEKRSAVRASKVAAERFGGSGSPRASGRVEKVVLSKRKAPTFYRSVPARGGEVRGAGRKACKNVGRAPAGSRIVFPVPRRYFDSFEESWGAARVQGGHEGTDLMVPAGTPEFAMTDGVVVPVSGSNSRSWNYLGGYTVMVRASYSIGPVKAGDIFYYAHMTRPTALKVGQRVKAGEVVGYAGDTGQGPEGTRGLFPPHLHFGWYDMTSGRSQVASGAMDPYPLLVWVERNGGSIEGGSNAPYCEAPAPAVPTPANGGSWNFPANPGVRPDLSTGTNSAAPTPAARAKASAETSPNVLRERTSRKAATQTTATRGGPASRKHPHAANRPGPKANVPETTVPETTVPETTIPRPPARKARPHKHPRRGMAREVRKVGAEVSGIVRRLLHPASGENGKPHPPHRPQRRGDQNVPPDRSQYRNGPEGSASAGTPGPAPKGPAPSGKPSDRSPACKAGGNPSERPDREGSGKPCAGTSPSAPSSGGSGKPAGRSVSSHASGEKPGSGIPNSSGASEATLPAGAPETTSTEPPPGDSTTGDTTGETSSLSVSPAGGPAVGETTSSVEGTDPAAPETAPAVSEKGGN